MAHAAPKAVKNQNPPLPVLDAVQKVLETAGKPMHVDALTSQILADGLVTMSGKTPAATVNSRLAMDIKTRGTTSRFLRTAPATFALRVQGHEPRKPSAGPPKVGTSVSFTDAAEAVLDSEAHGEPMHYKTIVEKALQRGWVKTSGKTPEATLYVSLISEIERATKRGETPRFSRQLKGLFGLSKWSETPLATSIAAKNQEVREALLVALHEMAPYEFESLVSQLLIRLGFEDAEVTKYSNDGGIDVRGTLVVGGAIRTRMAVQVKRWRHNVQAPVVQQVRGSLGSHDQGLIITTSDFGKGARQEASRPDAVPVALINGEQLVGLLAEHQIGIRRTAHDLLSLAPLDTSASDVTDA